MLKTDCNSLKNRQVFVAYIKLLIVVIFWGISYHSAKYLVEQADIYTVAFIRYLLATIILVILYIQKNGIKKMINKSPKQWSLLIMSGFIGVFIYNFCFFKAESLISANQVAILYALTPGVTVILCVAFLKSKMRVWGYLGILVSLFGTVGVILLSSDKVSSITNLSLLNNHQMLLGKIFALLAVFAMSIYNIMNKKIATINLEVYDLITFSAIFGLFFLAIVFFKFGNPQNIAVYTWKFWGAMLYTVVCATILCYKWYGDVINEIGVGSAAVFLNGVPLTSVLYGVFILGERISIGMLSFGIMIILGIVMVNYATNKC